MSVGIGDFCIQDDCISKVTRNSDCGRAFFYDHLTEWYINRDFRTLLTVEEFLEAVDIAPIWWEYKGEINSFLKEAWLYAIKTSYGIDLTK